MSSNLIPFSERSKEEVRALKSKGGKASVEARRRKKQLKDCMKALLSMPVTDTEEWNKLSVMGVNPSEIDNSMRITVALFLKACDGDVQAFKEIRNLIGEDILTAEYKLKEKQSDHNEQKFEHIVQIVDDIT